VRRNIAQSEDELRELPTRFAADDEDLARELEAATELLVNSNSSIDLAAL
jgi:hypothetical protein